MAEAGAGKGHIHKIVIPEAPEALSRELMFEVFEPLEAIEGKADVDFSPHAVD